MPVRRQILVSVLCLPALTASEAWAQDSSALLRQMVDGPQRSARNRARDPWRHPLETLAFWGLRPGMTVVEIEPSGGYWTEILAPYLAATKGRYIGAVGQDPGKFLAAYADRAVYGDVSAVTFGKDALCPPGTADLVLTARNFHDWLWTPGETAAALASFRAALHPQGVLGVEEHRADPRPMAADARDGYVSTAFLVDAVEKAGFALDGSSEINANPKDDKNHPFGVWTLPPTLRSHAKDQPTPTDYDAARYVAIGESDRMTLRFRRT